MTAEGRDIWMIPHVRIFYFADKQLSHRNEYTKKIGPVFCYTQNNNASNFRCSAVVNAPSLSTLNINEFDLSSLALYSP